MSSENVVTVTLPEKAILETSPERTITENYPVTVVPERAMLEKLSDAAVSETPPENVISEKPSEIFLKKFPGMDIECSDGNGLTGITIENLDGTTSVYTISADDCKINNRDESCERFNVQDCQKPIIRYDSYYPLNIDNRLWPLNREYRYTTVNMEDNILNLKSAIESIDARAERWLYNCMLALILLLLVMITWYGINLIIFPIVFEF